MSIFFVERYWPGVNTDLFQAAVGRLEAALEAVRASGAVIQHLGSTLVPDDESVFSVFEAVDENVVIELNQRAEFAFDRLLPAYLPAKETQS